MCYRMAHYLALSKKKKEYATPLEKPIISSCLYCLEFIKAQIKKIVTTVDYGLISADYNQVVSQPSSQKAFNSNKSCYWGSNGSRSSCRQHHSSNFHSFFLSLFLALSVVHLLLNFLPLSIHNPSPLFFLTPLFFFPSLSL